MNYTTTYNELSTNIVNTETTNQQIPYLPDYQ